MAAAMHTYRLDGSFCVSGRGYYFYPDRDPVIGDIVRFSRTIARPGRPRLWPCSIFINAVNDNSCFGTVARNGPNIHTMSHQDGRLAHLLDTYGEYIRMVGIAMNSATNNNNDIVYQVAIYVRQNAAGNLGPMAQHATWMLNDPHRFNNHRMVGAAVPNFGGLPPGGGNLVINAASPIGLIGVVPEDLTLPTAHSPP